MGRNSKMAVAAILALAIAGCSSEGEQQSSNPTPTNVPTRIKQAATQPFNNPVVPAKKAQSATFGSASLIQPTNATEHISVVSKGRADPFAQIVPQYPAVPTDATGTVKTIPASSGSATVTGVNPWLQLLRQKLARIRKTTSAAKTVPALPQLRIAKVVRETQTQKKVNPVNNLTRPVLPKVLPQVIPNQTLVSTLPPPPQPELAKAVQVTGVVLIGQEPQAIIKVPNEPTSRYVQAGQRLASGVLIKRIEMNEGSEPTVILEQYGIEVAKIVGETPINSKPSSASSGAT
jgi:hypothetical protein